ncbi:hypothetical protein BC938DRAFT_483408 [Jimgerdemannia flammicorona]|uniref:Uncharacterized protein n=1 Tax=Jimgerdemannia flammicorona TaxID=994334 RepID=A0A433QVT1_9FUNG|nr:hypothetical protein BC938DRAFT_483408 [Jimgerdemannia flammicorona]
MECLDMVVTVRVASELREGSMRIDPQNRYQGFNFKIPEKEVSASKIAACCLHLGAITNVQYVALHLCRQRYHRDVEEVHYISVTPRPASLLLFWGEQKPVHKNPLSGGGIALPILPCCLPALFVVACVDSFLVLSLEEWLVFYRLSHDY